MRKLFVISLLLILTLGLGAQSYDEFSKAFENFANATASALPFNSLLGLNWSDAYIGSFPHFGAGLTVGLTTMPVAGVEDALETLGYSTTELLSAVPGIGVPVPALMAEGRIGGLILPFDIGVKLGMLPENFPIPGTDISLDYLLAGFDVRYSLLKGLAVIPSISVGGGLNYLKGGVAVPGILGSNITLANFNGQDLQLTDPKLSLEWETLTIDVKAEASWSLLILNAYIGAGASYGVIANAGGGMESNIQIGGTDITDAQIEAIKTYYGEQFDLTDQSVSYLASVPAAWSTRVFAGASFNLLILKLDLSAMYNIMDGAIGAGLNVRIQF